MLTLPSGNLNQDIKLLIVKDIVKVNPKNEITVTRFFLQNYRITGNTYENNSG